uniref:MAM domain-containing protein n=1 Tax=Timema tahoe TaxID=61484 RepID=A0A7R9NW04_9NEOP|nr:unnamed protein product [Timema tahoe]
MRSRLGELVHADDTDNWVRNSEYLEHQIRFPRRRGGEIHDPNIKTIRISFRCCSRDSKQDQKWACNEEKGRKGEIGKVEKELPRKSARAAVLVARVIEPTTVGSHFNIECSRVQTFVKTATPSLPPYLQNILSKHGVCIREHTLNQSIQEAVAGALRMVLEERISHATSLDVLNIGGVKVSRHYVKYSNSKKSLFQSHESHVNLAETVTIPARSEMFSPHGGIVTSEFEELEAMPPGAIVRNGECRFERDTCEWLNDTQDRNSPSWRLATVSRRPANLPDKTFGAPEGYIYFDLFNQNSGSNTARLISPTVTASSDEQQLCFNFWFAAFGAGDSVELRVMRQDNSSNVDDPIEKLWVLDAKDMDTTRPKWTPAQVTVDANTDFRILLEGQATNGGFAVDDLTFSSGSCTTRPERAIVVNQDVI